MQRFSRLGVSSLSSFPPSRVAGCHPRFRASFSSSVKRRKIGLIGAGNIGSTIALMAAQKKLGDIVLFDIVAGMTKGKALDLSHSNPLSRTDVRITGTDKYSDLKGSDVIMITAGVSEKSEFRLQANLSPSDHADQA